MVILSEIIEKLTDVQKKLVKDCGFGSILKLKCKHLPFNQFIVRLASFYDEKTQSIKVPGTRPFKIDAKIVHWNLGIPYGGCKLSSKVTKLTRSAIAEDTTAGPKAPKIVDLVAMLGPKLVGDQFVRVFLLVLLSIFLCPSTADRASPRFYNGICVIKNINGYDWCEAVASCLNRGLLKFKHSLAKESRSPGLCGCLFVLYVSISTKITSSHL